jgi:regulator of sigma E protease
VITTIITVIIGIVALSIIIIAHEFGHFITAKMSGVKVEEFGIGFPPRLLSFQRGETRYSLNAIFFGGFTRMAGEEDPSTPRSLASQRVGIRVLILAAGSLMDFVLAFILFSVVLMFPHDASVGQIVVQDVALNSPAAVAGIEPGDIILSVNNQSVDSNTQLGQFIKDNLGKETTMLVRHQDGLEVGVQLTPRLQPPPGEGAIGISTRTLAQYPVWQAFPRGAVTMWQTVVLWWQGIIGVFKREVPAEFIGPVGLVQLTGEVATLGVLPLLNVSALISLILGICNLFPLPAIDGGRIVFALIEWVRRGKRISPRTEGMVHLIGMFLLLLFLFVITYQDILRIIRGGSLIP